MEGVWGRKFFACLFPAFGGVGYEKWAALFQSRLKIVIWILLVISSNFIQN